ncbi:hypothetical protein [Parvibaculum sp.]
MAQKFKHKGSLHFFEKEKKPGDWGGVIVFAVFVLVVMLLV